MERVVKIMVYKVRICLHHAPWVPVLGRATFSRENPNAQAYYEANWPFVWIN
jgi:hypothetical protein